MSDEEVEAVLAKSFPRGSGTGGGVGPKGKGKGKARIHMVEVDDEVFVDDEDDFEGYRMSGGLGETH